MIPAMLSCMAKETGQPQASLGHDRRNVVDRYGDLHSVWKYRNG